MNSFTISVLLTCPTGTAEWLSRLRAVLDPIERAGDVRRGGHCLIGCTGWNHSNRAGAGQAQRNRPQVSWR
jgi:hypothetical protein